MTGVLVRIVAVALAGAAGFGVGHAGKRAKAATADAEREPVAEVQASGGLVSALAGGWSMGGGSVFEMAMSIAAEVDEVGPERFGAVWDAVQKLPPGQRDRMEEVVIEWWAKADPEAALAAMGQRYDAHGVIYRIWAETEPEAAWLSSQAMRYDSLRESKGGDVLVGMARTNLEGAIEFAVAREIDIPSVFFEEWAASAEGGIIEVTERVIAFAKEGKMGSAEANILEVYAEENHEIVALFELVSAESGAWRDYAMGDILKEMMEIDPDEIMARAVEDPAWLGKILDIGDLFDEWDDEVDGVSLRMQWFDGLAADDPARAALAANVLDRALFRSEEEAAELLELVPEGQRETAVYDIAAYVLPESVQPQDVAARLDWVDRWKFELGPARYREALDRQIHNVESVEIDDVAEVEQALAMAERYGMRDGMMERFAYITPELAAPWMLQNLSPEERGPYMVSAFENFLEDEPEEALEMIATLSDPADIEALGKGIDDASISDELSQQARAIYEELKR